MTDDLPLYTEVTDVEDASGPITVYIGRSKHYIESGDRLTFVGDSNPDLFEKGKTYEYVHTDGGTVIFEEEDTPERVSCYREDLRYYLTVGAFHIHDV